MTYRKKLIEVALPLEAINAESAREKSIRHGHPSTLHLWWARRPLAACRAVLFAQLVDDPSSHPEEFPTEEAQDKERQRLFRIIEDLVKWENINNEHVLRAAQVEIRRSTGGSPPPVLDPFCGGGSIPLEALRLGLKAYASDLNPVAVLINKSLLEIPPKYAGRPPVHPEKDKKLLESEWVGARGLAEDVRFYGKWVGEEAECRIGALYPTVRLTEQQGGGEAKVIAWIWARTVLCPNPACEARSPISKTFQLSAKPGNQAYVEPVINREEKAVRFVVHYGTGQTTSGNVDRTGARCLICNSPVPLSHIRQEAEEGRLGQQLLAIVAEGRNRRVYLNGDATHIKAASVKELGFDVWEPTTDLPEQALGFRVQRYGMKTHASLFSPRQLLALGTFSDLIREAADRVSSISGDEEYGAAVATYLAFALDKAANYWSSLCSWYASKEIMVSTFGLPTLSMVWDFAEANPFSNSSGNWSLGVEQASSMLEALNVSTHAGTVQQLDAAKASPQTEGAPLVLTDPPYYDNIGYANLSDFFYVWLRRSLGKYYPQLFSTLLTPKEPELIAEPGRFNNNRAQAIAHFEEGLSQAFRNMCNVAAPQYPTGIFYAFKQQEGSSNSDDAGAGIASSGWEKMLAALIRAGFLVCGTWPIRTEQSGGLREAQRNALASSIVLVCRPREASAPMATRRDFVAALRKELPDALTKLQHGNIAPVDLAQATIGPGMAIFSRYAKVLEADGNPMTVRSALQIINQELDAFLAAQEGELDRDTRFCLAWFEQFGMNEGAFGEADVLARAKNTSVQGLVEAGVVYSKGGKVRLLKRDEYKDGWDPVADPRVIVWECTQQLIRRLNTGGEEAAARLVNRLGGGRSEEARALAYRLFSLSERKKWADEALAYNTLVVSWPAIQDKASQLSVMPSTQGELYE